MIFDKLNSYKLPKRDYRDLPTLQSCPFCGRDAEYRGTIHKQPMRTYYVICTGCRISTDLYIKPRLAAGKWNTRHSTGE